MKAADVYRPHEAVQAVLGSRRSTYEGPNKLCVSEWSGGHSDVPDITLAGHSVHPGTVKVAHDYFGLVREALGSSLKLIDLSESQIPNFLVLHVISTTVEDDEVLLLGRRRENVVYYPGYWTASWEEQLNVDEDEWDVGSGMFRGLKQEITGDRTDVVHLEDVKVFSLFREFDDDGPIRNPERVVEANCLLSLGIYCPIRLTFDDVLSNWVLPRDRGNEFTDIVGVRLTWRNIEFLLRRQEFDFLMFPDGVRFSPGTEKDHRTMAQLRLHPTARLRILGLASLRFPAAFERFVEEANRPF